MTNNIILKTDSYKLAHWKMYQDKLENVFSYFEMREGAKYREAVFFGLQAIIMKHLDGCRVDNHMIADAKFIVDLHMGPGVFNEEGWKYIVKEHNGRLPIRICAVPEGSVNPVSTVLMTIEATDPKCAWLVNYLETIISQVWYTSTVATLSREVKRKYSSYMTETLGNTDGIDFMLHDFGERGVSSMESAELGGMAHLVNFMGTDTVPALLAAKNFYRANIAALGFSVPATEHSVMTSLGVSGEWKIVGQLIEEFPTGILSVVGDSYDIYNFVSNIMGVDYKDAILARDGKFVVRPDSNTPTHPEPRDQMVWIYNELWEIFGGTYSDTGYKILNEKVGVLWGDGIDSNGITNILDALFHAGFATTNVSGMGGGLLQKVNRDTQRCAIKCSAQLRDGVWYDIQKNPLDQSKKSKTGRFEDLDLPVVFENGKLVKHYTFDEVRQNASL